MTKCELSFELETKCLFSHYFLLLPLCYLYHDTSRCCVLMCLRSKWYLLFRFCHQYGRGESTPCNAESSSTLISPHLDLDYSDSAVSHLFPPFHIYVQVGSWLLTKETCAAIATAITSDGYMARHSLVSKVGQLLLSTLTTLKHAGAAFAARDALQLIAIHCLKTQNSSDIRLLPDVWSRRLIDEISLNEKVRNSTLRRSTGYALGFLAIMRADVGNKSASSIISIPLLQKLLMLSLPPERRVKESLAKLKIVESQADESKLFVYSSNLNLNHPYIRDDQYEVSRIINCYWTYLDLLHKLLIMEM